MKPLKLSDFAKSSSLISNRFFIEKSCPKTKFQHLQALIDGLQSQILALNTALQLMRLTHKSSVPFDETEFDLINDSENQQISDYFAAALALERLCLIIFCAATCAFSAAFFLYGFSVQESPP